jgi:hypothetical protein
MSSWMRVAQARAEEQHHRAQLFATSVELVFRRRQVVALGRQRRLEGLLEARQIGRDALARLQQRVDGVGHRSVGDETHQPPRAFEIPRFIT